MKEPRNRWDSRFSVSAAELEKLYPPDPEPRDEPVAMPPAAVATLAVLAGLNCAAVVACWVILPANVLAAAGGAGALTWLAIYSLLRRWRAAR